MSTEEEKKWQGVAALLPKEKGEKVLLLGEKLMKLAEEEKEAGAKKQELARTEIKTLKEVRDLCQGIDAGRCPHPQVQKSGEALYCIVCNLLIDYD